MKIEDLTKQQIILLTLLVSFVTSIATGITTVTLVEQAPPAVTQTINRVIQKTIETVVPGQNNSGTQTIIIKEEDLVVDAIDKNAKSLVAIKEDVAGEKGILLGTGFVVSKSGMVITDNRITLEQGNYYIALDGVDYPAEFLLNDPRGFSVLRALPVKDQNTGAYKSFSFSSFGNSDALKVGQTVVAPSTLDGESLNVAKGIISRLAAEPASADAPEKITGIMLTMSLGRANSGGPLLNTDGEVIGLVLVKEGNTIVVPSNVLGEVITEIHSGN